MALGATEQSGHPVHRVRAWSVWALAAAAFGFAFFMRVSPSAMGDDLMRDFAVGAAVLGNLSAIYFYIYAGSQIPIGALMDRWGPRLMITLSIGLAAVGAGIFAIAEILYVAYLGRFLIGAGSACAFVGGLILAGRWFPPHRFAMMSGLTMLGGMAGGMLGQGPLASLVDAWGWRTTMLASAGFGAALALLVWLIVRDDPSPGAASSVSVKSGGDTLRGVKETLSNFQIWFVLAVGASFSGPLLAFGALWGVPYLMVKFGLERPDAALYTSLNLLGWALGAPLGGWLSDFLGRRKAPLLVAGLLNIVCLAILFYLPGIPLTVTAGLIFAVGTLSGTMVITYALAREITPPATHGTVTGFINMGTVGAGAILQPIIGLLLDWQWDGRIIDGARVYALEAYDTAFACLMLWAVLGVVSLAFLRETHCRPAVA